MGGKDQAGDGVKLRVFEAKAFVVYGDCEIMVTWVGIQATLKKELSVEKMSSVKDLVKELDHVVIRP